MSLKTYIREGREAVLDVCRGKLVPRTPEEIVRQRIVGRLTASGVPAALLRTEYHLGPDHGYNGRVDIAILEKDRERDEEPMGLAVIECKEPGQTLLDDKVRQKLFEYADAMRAPWALFTNGVRDDEVAFGRNGRGMLVEIDAFPSWKQIRQRAKVQPTAYASFSRWNYDEIACACRARAMLEAEGLNIVGEGSPDLLVPVAANLFGLLADDSKSCRAAPVRRGSLKLCEDLGRKARDVRIAAGGRWPSRYWRSFLVRQGEEYSTVSLALFAQGKTVNDPWYGNVRGSTILVGVVDSLEKSQIAYELSLDKTLRLINGQFRLVHDGLMTLGPQGRVPLARVYKHLKKNAPDLVGAGGIDLGSFPADKSCTWENAGELVINLLRYAVLRDELKRKLSAVGAKAA